MGTQQKIMKIIQINYYVYHNTEGRAGGGGVYDLTIQPAEKHQHLCPGTQETLNAAKFASEKHKRIGYLIEEISKQFSHASRSSLF